MDIDRRSNRGKAPKNRKVRKRRLANLDMDEEEAATLGSSGEYDEPKA